MIKHVRGHQVKVERRGSYWYATASLPGGRVLNERRVIAQGVTAPTKAELEPIVDRVLAAEPELPDGPYDLAVASNDGGLYMTVSHGSTREQVLAATREVGDHRVEVMRPGRFTNGTSVVLVLPTGWTLRYSTPDFGPTETYLST